MVFLSFKQIIRDSINKHFYGSLVNGSTDSRKIQHITLKADKPDAKKYYTFSGLAFSILFMGLLIGYSVYPNIALHTSQN